MPHNPYFNKKGDVMRSLSTKSPLAVITQQGNMTVGQGFMQKTVSGEGVMGKQKNYSTMRASTYGVSGGGMFNTGQTAASRSNTTFNTTPVRKYAARVTSTRSLLKTAGSSQPAARARLHASHSHNFLPAVSGGGNRHPIRVSKPAMLVVSEL